MTANNASQTTIANFALSHLGAGRILSTDDTSEKAIIMKLFYDHARQFSLQSFNWQFARKRDSLASLSQAPAFEYDFQYEVPSDFLRLVQVDIYYPQHNYSLVVAQNSQPYTIEGNRILTNLQAPLKIYYTADIEDATQFSPLFTQYLSLQLALMACEQITQSNTKKNDLYNQAEALLRRVAMADRSQLPPQQAPTGGFLNSRIVG